MSVLVETGHTPPGQPLTHARILHALNRLRAPHVKSASADVVAVGYDGDEWNGLETAERWKPHDNILTEPSDLSDAAWTLTGATLSGAGRVLVEDGTTGQHRVAQTVALTAGTFIAAVRVNFQTQGGARLTLTDGTSTFTVSAFYDGSSALQVSSSGSPVSFDAVEQSDGTVLLRLVAICAAGSGEVRVNMLDDGTLSYQGDTDNTIRVNRVSLHASEAVATLTLHDQKSVTTCCFQALNLGSTGGRVSVEFSVDEGQNWTVIEEFTLTDDGAVMVLFASRTGDAFRIKLIDAVEPELSVLRFGNALEMTQAIYGGHGPVLLQRNVEYRTNLSETNEILGRTKIRGSNGAAFEWTHIKADWVRSNWMTAQRAFESEPVFMAWRPETFPSEIVYGTMMSGEASNMGQKDYMSLGASITGYAHD